MFKRFIPFCTAKNIYEINIDFFKRLGVNTLLVDLDNTLDSYKLYTPTKKAFDLYNNLKANNIEMVVISNNRGKRVSSYANALGARFIYSASKPFSFKIKRFIKENSLDISHLMFIGDQMMTDVLAAKGAGLRMVLTDKLVKEDQWTTHINRIFGKRIRNYHQKKGNLKDWRTIHV